MARRRGLWEIIAAMRARRRVGPGPGRGAAGAVAAALAALAAGCVTARGTSDRPVVTSLEIEGARSVPAGDIREKLVTQKTSWVPFTDTFYYEPDVFEADLKRILRFYRSRGFYAARITASEARPDGEGRVALVVKVEEGPPTRVAEIRIEGLEGQPDALAKLGRMPMEQGAVFTEDGLDADGAAVRKALADNGYAQAQVKQSAQVDPDRNEAVVRYLVEPGPRYRVGSLFVAGTAAVSRARVREAAENAIRPGDVLDESQLPKAQAWVFDLGVFGGVRVTKGTPDPARGTVPVVIAVREAPFRTIRLGPGIGIAANRWSAGAYASWTHRNWFGGLRRLQLEARAGYAWLPNPWSVEKRGLVGKAAAELRQPEVFYRGLDLTLRLEAEKGIEQAYTFTAERLRVGTPLRFGRVVTFVPSINFEVYQLQGDATKVEVGGGSLSVVRSCPGNPCVLSYLEQRVDLDLRDDVLETRKGLYIGVALQEGFKLAGYGFGYLRLLPEARGFIPLGARPVLALRARFGLLKSLGGDVTPIVARFTGGGPSTMRGYYQSRLSPVTQLASGAYAPVGGEGLVDGSAEVRFPLAGELWGVVFLDAGNVTLAAQDALRLDRLQFAAGLGVRYRTPFGPLRFDIASRLPQPSGGKWGLPTVPLVTIGPDGRSILAGAYSDIPTVAAHLSLGEAF